MTTETCVYVVKTTDGRLPTVYGEDTRLDYVAGRVRESINYPDVSLEWIGTAVVMGGTADHPRIGHVVKTNTLTKLFKSMVYNPEENNG